MKILYIFPHPDDETFGPALAIAKQKRQGHQVFLLTLTKGGATKQRFLYNYTIEQMGEVRYKEMQEVAKVLNLDSMKVLNFPDSGLKELDPRALEKAIKAHIKKIKPHIIITYPVHGISGFHDHIVGHTVVKRVYLELKDKLNLKRLAFITLTQEGAEKSGFKGVNFSKPEEIDCILGVGDQEKAVFNQCLDCYKTYKEVIEESKIREMIEDKVYFEIFQETFNPPLTDLTEHL